jgi:hypothetical protein
VLREPVGWTGHVLHPGHGVAIQRIASGGQRANPARAVKDTGVKAARELLVGLEERDVDCWTSC